MQLMPFRVQVDDVRRIAGMDDAEYWLHSGEMPAMFLWAIRGLDRLRSTGRWTKSAVCEEAMYDYRLEVNPARAFLEESCSENSLDSIPTNELYEEYKKWCSINGYRPLSERQFGKEVFRKFPKINRKRLGPQNDRFFTYFGISFKRETSGAF
jgi:phage/plasmid-associated DNA primase